MYFIRLLILAFVACSCGSDGFRGTTRIGIDTKWYPIDFGSQTAYVNGYTEDLLLEMAIYSGMTFELVPANWDALTEGLKERRYDAILTSMPPYDYNLAKYDFSKNYLDLGPVLIVPIGATQSKLTELEGHLVGIINNDPSALILEKHPAIIIRNYNSIPELLNAVAAGDIQAALLAKIPAVNFVKDLYAGKLKISSDPLSDAGLHLVGPKGRIGRFTKTLEALRKRKSLDSLLKKWGLTV
jgi:ABC-type amino acid transport substrate-binding protein